MTKSQAIQWKTACWVTVGGFTVASAWFAWSMHQFAQPGSTGLMCGNSVTDPLGAILSAAPFGFGGVAGLLFLLRRGFAGWLSVATSAILTFGCTVGLLIFGFRFFQDMLPGFHLSQIVWWLKPFGV